MELPFQSSIIPLQLTVSNNCAFRDNLGIDIE